MASELLLVHGGAKVTNVTSGGKTRQDGVGRNARTAVQLPCPLVMEPVVVVLHGALRSLARRPGTGPLSVPLQHPRSAKDAIESLGIPHTEVGAVVVDQHPRGLDHRLEGGERVRVHDVVDPLPPGTRRLAPAPPTPVRLVADVHLGTLARRLRVLGLDTRWRNDADDDALAAVAIAEGRVLLTRDRGLLMRRAVVHGALVRADDPDRQLTEVVERLDLAAHAAPGTRCPRCNGAVSAVPRDQVVDELEPGTRAAGYEAFGRCRDCRQLYWAGAHADALAAIIDRAT